MDIRYRVESKRKLYSCISGCCRTVSAYTQFSDEGRGWAEYCDECAADIPWTGVSMYVEFTWSCNTYTIYNTYKIFEIHEGLFLEHDFHLKKI